LTNQLHKEMGPNFHLRITAEIWRTATLIALGSPMINERRAFQKLMGSSRQCTVTRCLKLAMPLVLACGLTVACQESSHESSGITTENSKTAQGRSEIASFSKQLGGKHETTIPMPERNESTLAGSTFGTGHTPDSERLKVMPKDVEVAPPAYPGELGITQEEILLQEKLTKTDASFIEVAPPATDGELAPTQAEIEAQMKTLDADAGQGDLEVAPPMSDGEQVPTQAEKEPDGS